MPSCRLETARSRSTTSGPTQRIATSLLGLFDNTSISSMQTPSSQNQRESPSEHCRGRGSLHETLSKCRNARQAVRPCHSDALMDYYLIGNVILSDITRLFPRPTSPTLLFTAASILMADSPADESRALLPYIQARKRTAKEQMLSRRPDNARRAYLLAVSLLAVGWVGYCIFLVSSVSSA
jgi:hypothetical protein